MTSSSGAMSKFVVAGQRCLACKGPMPKEGRVTSGFCKHCAGTDKEVTTILEKLAEYREKETDFNRFWTTCQACQGSYHQDIICTSRDCPIFYRRTKVKKDILEMSKNFIARLDLDSW